MGGRAEAEVGVGGHSCKLEEVRADISISGVLMIEELQGEGLRE